MDHIQGGLWVLSTPVALKSTLVVLPHLTVLFFGVFIYNITKDIRRIILIPLVYKIRLVVDVLIQ
jgi:hypothetical protein